MQSIFIEAREWYDKTGGNSYFSARISVDGELVGHLPLQYGYGSAYEYEATKWLLANGYISERIEPLWRLRESGVAVYSVKYPTTKFNAKRFGKTWQEVAA
jgi:hypothetical protein